MAKLDVLNLVAMLGNNQPDASVVDKLYDDLVNEWAAGTFRLSNATLIQTTPQNPEFTLPEPIRNVASVIWDDTTLSLLSLRELEALNPQWRQESGTPVAFTNETENVKVLALYPNPYQASLGALPPDPLGSGYLAYNAVVFHSETRVDVPSYWELPLALQILKREFVRESDHRDETFAEICGMIGDKFLEMLT